MRTTARLAIVTSCVVLVVGCGNGAPRERVSQRTSAVTGGTDVPADDGGVAMDSDEPVDTGVTTESGAFDTGPTPTPVTCPTPAGDAGDAGISACDATSWPLVVDDRALDLQRWTRTILLPRVLVVEPTPGTPLVEGESEPGFVPTPAVRTCAGLAAAECRRVYEPTGNTCLRAHANTTSTDATTLGSDDGGAYACGPAGAAGVCAGGVKQTQFATLGEALESALVNGAPPPDGVTGDGTVPECAAPAGGLDLTRFTLLDAAGSFVPLPAYDSSYRSTADPAWQTAVRVAVAGARRITDASGASFELTPSSLAWITAFATEIGGRDAGLPACRRGEPRSACYSASIALYAGMSAWVAAQVLPSDRHLLTATYLLGSLEPAACNTTVPEAVFASRLPLHASPTFVAYFDPDSTWPATVGIPNDVAFIARAAGTFTVNDVCGAGGTASYAAVLATGDPSPCNCTYSYSSSTYGEWP